MPLIQLQPHPFTSIPAHPSFPTDLSRPELHQFIHTALHEALELLHSIPSTFVADPKLRSSPPSQAKVKLLRGWRNPSEPSTKPTNPKDKTKSEFWACRQTEHVDASAEGTASWREFEDGLKSEHAEHEMEYTRSVSAVERLLEWAPQDVGEVEVDGIRFRDVNMEVNLITHTFQPSALIAPRSFISLTISAAHDDLPPQPPQTQGEHPPPRKGFLIVQIPLHQTSSSTPQALQQKISSSVPKRTIFANYVSVEHVTLLPPSSYSSSSSAQAQDFSGKPKSRVEWTMATTADPGGSIPKWVQRNFTLGGMPRAVVADVGFFIGWTMRRRGST
ncbi:uncharacterized protein N7482_005395 [Penicillium canariense]|uniref:DUF3074 domain-containing protein n=1 Tax=Penicillium canariense TaxID=189055 RepID=A0A9W9LM85_9EURO|nr:uncharacterized protein N7482_005395 [Penicillium canariense]KAJ5166614.1 hypothetical protein N7482_005395 [Penicillium canariense]